MLCSSCQRQLHSLALLVVLTLLLSLDDQAQLAAGASLKPRPASKEARLHMYSPEAAYQDLEAVLHQFTQVHALLSCCQTL